MNTHRLVREHQRCDAPGTRWLLARLCVCFRGTIKIVCKHRRFGSMLMHKKCDILKALSSALARYSTKGTNNTHICTDQSTINKATNDQATTDQIQSVASSLNIRLHRQAKRLIDEFSISPSQYGAFHLVSAINKMDPILIQFMQCMTQSVRGRHQNQPINELSHEKQLRQFYSLCVLLFCTNAKCSMPMHTILTEAVLCHGGSQELVKVLNRVGAIAALDTS